MLLVCDSDKLRVKVFELYLSHLFAVMLCQRIGRLAEVLAYLCAYICKGDCSCGTRDKPKPVSPLSRRLSWLGRCTRLAFRNGTDGHVPKSTTVAVQGVYKEPWPKNIKYEY